MRIGAFVFCLDFNGVRNETEQCKNTIPQSVVESLNKLFAKAECKLSNDTYLMSRMDGWYFYSSFVDIFCRPILCVAGMRFIQTATVFSSHEYLCGLLASR